MFSDVGGSVMTSGQAVTNAEAWFSVALPVVHRNRKAH